MIYERGESPSRFASDVNEQPKGGKQVRVLPRAQIPFDNPAPYVKLEASAERLTGTRHPAKQYVPKINIVGWPANAFHAPLLGVDFRVSTGRPALLVFGYD